ncbi:MAG: transketolase family protein [Oscillospiraceae bacterium]|jgi:transketolase|nr:transketolase family protein [Oscillospiraceae bacterium]
MYENVEMRKVFCDELDRLMEKDARIAVLDADLAKANGTLRLRDKYPDRAFDVGIAEQNMASVAAGMAAYGMIPFIGSFAPFVTRRICDQLAISVSYACQSVKIVGSDPGITAEYNGGTHMSFEDIGVLRSIPNFVIFEPADAVELAKSLPQIVAHDGPIYLRLARKAAPVVYGGDYQFELLSADVLRPGKDVSVFASGIMVHEALEAEKLLRAENIDAEIINIHTVKPIDADAVVSSVKKTGVAVTCENHNVIGGLRSAVAEVLTERCPAYIAAVGIPDCFGVVGKMPYLKEKFGLTSRDIAAAVRNALDRKSKA